jgi:hypothetical protein
MIKKSQKVDDTLFLGVIAGTTLALLIWTSIVVYDIQQDVKEIRGTLDTMREILEPMVEVPKQANMILETNIAAKSNEE